MILHQYTIRQIEGILCTDLLDSLIFIVLILFRRLDQLNVVSFEILGVAIMENTYSKFWDADEFILVSDGTKPAMRWAVEALRKKGKTVHFVDLSDRPELDAIKSAGEAPDGVEHAVIGVTKVEPANVVGQLLKKGVVHTWIHWNTDTPALRDICADHQCYTGRCPMMYLGNDLSIHGMHRAVAKVMGKY